MPNETRFRPVRIFHQNRNEAAVVGDVSGQSAKRMMNGQVRACLRMPASDWIRYSNEWIELYLAEACYKNNRRRDGDLWRGSIVKWVELWRGYIVMLYLDGKLVIF